MDYETNIRREGSELTVIGQLWEDGAGLWDTWGDTGTTFEVQHEPEFSIVELYDDNDKIVSLSTLTPKEILVIIDMFTQDYWDHIL
jgi:hypothetical protein|tara:strand:- start:1442 stop:1699 length:258 start_codon:yes stop_codon:yes gene_type:complete